MNKQEIISKLEMTIIYLMSHPDNEPNSEFADRIDDLIDTNQAINVIQCCKSDSELLSCGCPICGKEMTSQLVKHHHCKECKEHFTTT